MYLGSLECVLYSVYYLHDGDHCKLCYVIVLRVFQFADGIVYKAKSIYKCPIFI